MHWEVAKPVRLTLYVVEVLLVMGLAGLMVMDTSWFQRVLEQRVIYALENLTGGRVEIARFRFKPWIFQITMQDLVIHGTEAAGEAPPFSVREVEVGLSPEQFLRRRLYLRHLDVDQLQVHLRTNGRRITNLPHREVQNQGSAQQGLAGLMNLAVGRLTILHSVFFWNDQVRPVAVDARELALLLTRKRGHYSGAISSSATTIRSAGWASLPINFNSRFELSASALKFSRVAWQAPNTSGEATFTIPPQIPVQASGSFHASLNPPSLATIFHSPEWRAGTLLIEGIAAFQDGRVSVRGRAQARKAVISLPSVPNLSLDITTSYALDNNQLDLTDLVASVWGGTIEGSLRANFQQLPVTFHLSSRLYQVRLESLLNIPGTPSIFGVRFHPASNASGNLSAMWSGRGQGLKAEFNVTLQASPRVPSGALPVSGAARGTVELGRASTLHLTECQFRTSHSTIAAHGTLAQLIAANDPFALTITTDDFDEWRPFFEWLVETPSGIPLELNSQAAFSGEFSGSYDKPSLQGNVNIGQFKYRNWTWDRLSADVILNPGLVQISAGRVEHKKSSFELSGSAQLNQWRLTPSSMVHLSARAQDTAIDGLKAAVSMDLPVRGSVSGHIEIEGAVANLTGVGSVRITDGTFANEPFTSFSTRLQVAGSTWKLQAMELTKNRGHMNGDITLDPARHFASGRLQGTDFRLSEIRHLRLAASAAVSKQLEGDLKFVVHGQGTPQGFHLQSSWQINKLRIAGTPLGEFKGTLAGDGNQLGLEVVNQNPGGNLRIRAKATAKGDWPLEAEGEYSNVRADPWIRAFFNREFATAVTLGGSFHGVGPLLAPTKISVQSRASTVAVDFPSVQWRNIEPVDLHYSEGRLTVNRFIMRGPSTELAIAGDVGFSHGVTLAMSAVGTANATLLNVFDSNLQAAGPSTLQMRLTGTPSRPLLNGAMDIQDVSLTYRGLPFRFSNLHGTINLQGERAVISSLRGACGGGTVNLSGSVTLVERPRYEVRVEVSQVRVRYPTSFTSTLDGDLRLAGGVDQAQLQGEIVVRQMLVNENINLVSNIIESSNTLVEPVPAIDSPVASKIRLNVRVTSAPPVQVQTPNFMLVGDIDLRLQGTLANPVQVGSIHLLRGESVFRGNRYTLVRGDLNMTNSFRTQGYLDMEVETRVQNYDLTVDVSGPLDRLKSAYRSDPPLGTSDIFSLLALGYVHQGGAFSPVGGSPTASIGATAILSEALSSQTTSRIQHLFGVSRIKIDPNVGVPGFISAGALVTVEQQVTHDLTLTYVTDTSYSQYRIIQFEWNVSDKVSVLGIRDQNGVFGVEFRFRRRFK